MTQINRISTSYIEMKDAFIRVQSSGILFRVGEGCSLYSSMQTGSFFIDRILGFSFILKGLRVSHY